MGAKGLNRVIHDKYHNLIKLNSLIYSVILYSVGSSDSTVKVWDIIKQYYTHNFKGSQGVVK